MRAVGRLCGAVYRAVHVVVLGLTVHVQLPHAIAVPLADCQLDAVVLWPPSQCAAGNFAHTVYGLAAVAVRHSAVPPKVFVTVLILSILSRAVVIWLQTRACSVGPGAMLQAVKMSAF